MLRAPSLAASMLAALLLCHATSAAQAQRQAPARARGMDASPPLPNGASRWAADTGTGPLAIIVSLARQQLFVYRDGRLIAQSTISSGDAGHETPLGSFNILQKSKWHRSNLYSDAPMPFMQRLTWDGIALHAGELPGHPASHGCIRLPRAFAERLFALTRPGTPVTVLHQFGAPPVYLPVSNVERMAGNDASVSSGPAAPDTHGRAPPKSGLFGRSSSRD